MNFKDQLKKDLDVFININEFAEPHTIDKIQMAVLIDYEGLEEISKTQNMEQVMQGIYQSKFTIFVKSQDYFKPDLGYRLNLDGDDFYVVGANESDGLLEIILSSYES